MAASSSGSTPQRNALVLAHLSLADSIGAARARRLFPLVEREDLIQVAREALVHAAARCFTGALQHHLRDRVRLVRVSRREHEKGLHPLAHVSLDLCPDGQPSLLEQLPAAQAAALRLTVLEGLSLRQAASRLGNSATSVQRAQRRALASLRRQIGA